MSAFDTRAHEKGGWKRRGGCSRGMDIPVRPRGFRGSRPIGTAAGVRPQRGRSASPGQRPGNVATTRPRPPARNGPFIILNRRALRVDIPVRPEPTSGFGRTGMSAPRSGNMASEDKVPGKGATDPRCLRARNSLINTNLPSRRGEAPVRFARRAPQVQDDSGAAVEIFFKFMKYQPLSR